MKKILYLFLAVTVLISALGACGTSDYIMKFENKKVSINYYTYWLSRYKAAFMYYYKDIDDTAEFWDSEYSEGITADGFLTSAADSNIIRYLIGDYLCDINDIDITDETLDAIDQQLKDILDENAEGNVSAFNSDAAQFGINYKMLRSIYIMEARSDLAYDYIIENQIEPSVTDAVIEDYYRNNYCRIKHIYISTEFSVNYDEEGEPLYDEDGEYTVDYTEEEKAAQQVKISELEALITADNFFDYIEEYNEDPAVDRYKNGFYLSANTNYDANIIRTGLTMNVGEVKKVDTPYGVYFIYKQELDENAWSKNENGDFFANIYNDVCDKLYEDYISDYIAAIETNEEVKEGISIKTVSPCWYY